MITLRSGGWVRLMFVGFLLLVPLLAVGKTVTVSPDSKGGISDALANANFGDVILVACGTYQEGSLFIPDGVTLRGSPDNQWCVQIETWGYYPLITIEDAGSMTRVENLMLTVVEGGMIQPVARGGGVYLKNASPVFTNVTIVGMEADYGGAVYCGEASSPSFVGCRFEDNYARAVGGAVACTGASSPTFERCLFTGNTAETSGGTINAAMDSDPLLTECTVVRGRAAVGSGLASWDLSYLKLLQTILVEGQDGRGWDGDFASVPEVICSDIYGNEGGDWVGALEPQAPMDGNISADPQFCGVLDEFTPYYLNDASPCAIAGCGVMGAFPVNCSFTSGTGGGTGALPTVSRLHPNYPNPFNPRTTIKFDLKQAGPVELAVFDVAGRLVKRLVGETLAAGQHDAVWEGKDTSGRSTAAGVYFFRLKTHDTIDTKRMTLIK